MLSRLAGPDSPPPPRSSPRNSKVNQQKMTEILLTGPALPSNLWSEAWVIQAKNKKLAGHTNQQTLTKPKAKKLKDRKKQMISKCLEGKSS